MDIKTKYILSYTLDKESKDLVLEVELRQTEGISKRYQNVWQGFATLNGKPYEEEDLSHCVDAKIAAIRIGHKLRDNLKNDAKENNKKFRVKNEEIK
jgi:hypothetical protein